MSIFKGCKKIVTRDGHRPAHKPTFKLNFVTFPSKRGSVEEGRVNGRP